MEARAVILVEGTSERSELEAAGFYACTRDLEDELTRAVGPDRMERVLEDQGKQRYAALLVEAADLERVPRPLDRVLSHLAPRR